jgi:hypothetical protein
MADEPKPVPPHPPPSLEELQHVADDLLEAEQRIVHKMPSIPPPARLVVAGVVLVCVSLALDVALTLAGKPIPSLLPTAFTAGVALLFGRSLLRLG